ncbi:MAG: hypothetical protein NC078_01805 [Ruminococcus sp.]|nr:hypothetical protein [Ruminococcus sp.]
MTAVFIITGVILAALGAAVIIIRARQKPPEIMEEEYKSLTEGCGEFGGVVLDVHKETVNGRKRRVMIVQIRFEDQKRTVIHKCTEEFFGKYSRGEHIKVLFREGKKEDFAILPYDNRFVKGKGIRDRVLSVWGGVMLIVMGVVFMVGGIFG